MDNAAQPILLIDDDISVRRLFATYLVNGGHAVVEAENGRVGLDLIREKQPMMVLCDLRMPEMDGLAVLEVVTRDYPDMPIILVSGHGDLTDAIKALQLGAWDYVTKPTRMPVLLHAVDRALERVRLIKENRDYQQRLESTNQQLRATLEALQIDEEAGRQIQFQLLPINNLKYGPCQFSRTLLPSSSLSGDFVDYFQIDSHHLGFYLADVSGHGVSSALITVILKSMMTHQLEDFWRNKSDMILDPVALLGDFNQALLAQNLKKYLTIFYGIIDLEQNMLRFSNCGQFPFPVLYDGKDAKFIGKKSQPVGLFTRVNYQIEELQLPKHFLLVLCSDGILEVLTHAKVTDKEAAIRARVNDINLGVEEFLAGLGITERETLLVDDVTVLIVRR
jgi:sigma-B regulation protein RsbU (phosphoserine phosphatase)